LKNRIEHNPFFARADEETVLAILELERVMKLGADPFIFLI
jgi:hypothetical protein